MGSNQNAPPNIDQQDLKLAYKKALLFAIKKLNKFQNSGIACKIEPLDLVNEACEKTWSGQREWNQESTPDLFVHLAGCMNSILSNIYTSSDFKLIERSESGETSLMNKASNCNLENSLEFDSKVSFIIDYVAAAKKDIQTITELMLRDGITEPKEIASALGISTSEVNTQKVALKRVMQRISFKLHYIARNRKDLIEISRAIYIQKVTDIEELSQILKIPPNEVTQKQHELEFVLEEIDRGVI